MGPQTHQHIYNTTILLISLWQSSSQWNLVSIGPSAKLNLACAKVKLCRLIQSIPRIKLWSSKSDVRNTHTHTHTVTLVFYGPRGFCPGLPRWAGTRNVKPIWIYWSKTAVQMPSIIIGWGWKMKRQFPTSVYISDACNSHYMLCSLNINKKLLSPRDPRDVLRDAHHVAHKYHLKMLATSE